MLPNQTQASTVLLINSGSLHPPSGGGHKGDRDGLLDCTRNATFPIDACRGIALETDPCERRERPEQDDSTFRDGYRTGNFQEEINQLVHTTRLQTHDCQTAIFSRREDRRKVLINYDNDTAPPLVVAVEDQMGVGTGRAFPSDRIEAH
jgi:hypothetical protein